MFLGRHVYSFILNKPKPYSIGNAQEEGFEIKNILCLTSRILVTSNNMSQE